MYEEKNVYSYDDSAVLIGLLAFFPAVLAI